MSKSSPRQRSPGAASTFERKGHYIASARKAKSRFVSLPWGSPLGLLPAFSLRPLRFERIGQMPAEGRQQPKGLPHGTLMVIHAGLDLARPKFLQQRNHPFDHRMHELFAFLARSL